MGAELCFEEAAKAWLVQATTRSRKRMRLTTVPTIQSALRNYIYPAIGNLPLTEVHNGTVKLVVDRLKAKGLSSATINNYVNICKSVMKSIIDPLTGEPVYNRKWNSTFLDIEQPEHTKTPCITAAEIEAILDQCVKGSWEYRLFLLLASTGLRIGEVLGLEWKHLINDGRTLVIEQQVNRFGQVVKSMKTKSGKREVDLHPDVTKVLLDDCPGSKTGLLFCTKNGTAFLPGNVEKRRLRDFFSGGFHAFRRYRNTHLRTVGCLEDLRMFWLGHKPSSMGEVYSKLSRDVVKRLEEAEKVGLGFELKTGCLPRPWRRIICLTSDRLRKQERVA